MSEIRAYFEEIVRQTLNRFDNGELSEGDLRMLARPMEWSQLKLNQNIVGLEFSSQTATWSKETQAIFDIPVQDQALSKEAISWLKKYGYIFTGELTLHSDWEGTAEQSSIAREIIIFMNENYIWPFVGRKIPWIPPYHNSQELIALLLEITEVTHWGTPWWRFILSLRSMHITERYNAITRQRNRNMKYRAGIYIEHWLDEDGNFNPCTTSK